MNTFLGAFSALAALTAIFICMTYEPNLALTAATLNDSLHPRLWNIVADGEKGQVVVQEGTDARSTSWKIIEHLGGNSPWFRKIHGTAEVGLDPPEGCWVDQIHLLSRHAERFPTIAAGIGMLELYQRIRQYNGTLRGDLSFANDWSFLTQEPAEHFENLVSTGPYAGTLEAFATGVKLRTRYKHLLDLALEQNATSFWASASQRVVDTARYFAAGSLGIDWQKVATLHLIPEDADRAANTLTPGRTCLRWRDNGDDCGHDYGVKMTDAFRQTYEPAIVDRLAEQNPDFPFTEQEVFIMQQLCGFETIAIGRSSWCDVFTRAEWESFEYSRDLLHYYRTGPGNPYSGSMGWLWLNATSNLMEEGSSAGRLFFSFVHDGDIIPVLTALDLFPQVPDLPTSHILHNRTWRSSDVTPMGGRVLFERLLCPAPKYCWSNAPYYPNHVYCEEQTYDVSVRVNVNDGIIAIPGCSNGPGNSCPLDDFVERVREQGTNFERFGNICGLAANAPKKITFLHQ